MLQNTEIRSRALPPLSWEPDVPDVRKVSQFYPTTGSISPRYAVTETLWSGVPLTGRPNTNGVTGAAYVSSGAVRSGAAKGAIRAALPRSGSPGVDSMSGPGTEACLSAVGPRGFAVGSARLGLGQSTYNKHCATLFHKSLH